jgi:hypothetical protein
MASSSGEKLYRTARSLVTLASVALLSTQIASAQYSTHRTAPKTSKGPRALGLLELGANGKGRLLPICILYDGKFYDASAYKADPVPMALDTGIVYEAERTGASVGLFTITSALQTKDSWWGAGRWEADGAKPKKKVATAAKPPTEDTDAPPVLRRSGASTPKAEPSEPPKTEKAPEPATPAPTPPPASAAATPAPADDDHPVLKHGKQVPFEDKESVAAKTPAAKAAAAAAPDKTPTVQLIPAISDAHGPEPLPFKFDLKPDEESVFRKKMLALASDEVIARAKALAAQAIPAEPAKKARPGKNAPKPPQPAIENVDLRVFDLTSSNEPIVVLTATAHMPLTANAPASPLEYYVTIVARNDIYGDLHKAFVNISDNQHLDILPRMELIDAVDADGDGRGELLFRQNSDAGKAYVIYRVIGDSVYTLYQGTPAGG